jgi:hypothetical protein
LAGVENAVVEAVERPRAAPGVGANPLAHRAIDQFFGHFLVP